MHSENRWQQRILRLDWLGQTAASLFWIASVFTYGITSTGDWLQLFAASAWLIANLAALNEPVRSQGVTETEMSADS